jgi:hypothetical protein
MSEATDPLKVDVHARAFELAVLAARICPVLCQQEPTHAIELAQALLKAAHTAIDPDRELNELAELAQQHDAELEQYRSFEAGVRFITGERRFDRAMPWFRKFIKARSESEQVCDDAIASARANGFTTFQLSSLQGQFTEWKANDKSQTARAIRAKRAVKETGENRSAKRKSVRQNKHH